MKTLSREQGMINVMRPHFTLIELLVNTIEPVKQKKGQENDENEVFFDHGGSRNVRFGWHGCGLPL